jgi:plasmid stabilization system protein ParE
VEIYFSDSALNDLQDIKDYYIEKEVPHIGDEFVFSIVERVETLKDNPDIGRMVPEFQEAKIRELILPPFRVVYLREITSIHIVRVWRSERELVLPEEQIKTKTRKSKIKT